MSARELLQKAAERIESLTSKEEDITKYAQQLEEANNLLAAEIGLIKTAFKMVEYQMESGYETYEEALEKAASFESEHGPRTLTVLDKQASGAPIALPQVMGKAANTPDYIDKSSMSAEEKLFNSMLRILHTEE